VKYTVVWAPGAEQDLAAIWASAADRAEIARAANSLDRQLSLDPGDVGESRPDGKRIGYSLPLGIHFRVREADRLVRVLTVWLCSRPGDPDRSFPQT